MKAWPGNDTGSGARGRARWVAATVVLALAAVGCGSGGSEEGATVAPSGDASSAEGFPVTIAHKFGETRIAEPPERVLSLGYQEHDTILALGVVPIAARYWFGDEDDVIFPWAEEAAGGADPEILNMPHGELNYEKIAALRPDLILGVYSGITDAEYEKLAAIAPTVAQTDEYVDFGVPWQVMVRTVGRALGRTERAEELVAEVESRFADVRRAHPEFADRTVIVAVPPFEGSDGGFGVFKSQDPRARFFTDLGFVVPPAIDGLDTGEGFYGTVSKERLDLLEADVLVWDQLQLLDGGRSAVESDPLVGQIPAMQESRAVFLEGDLEDAFAFNSVLSLPFVIDGVLPQLEAATAGLR